MSNFGSKLNEHLRGESEDPGGFPAKPAPTAREQWEAHEAAIDKSNAERAKKAYDQSGGWEGELRRSRVTDVDRARHAARISENQSAREAKQRADYESSKYDIDMDGDTSWLTSPAKESAPTSDRAASPRRRFGSLLGHFKRFGSL